MRRMARGWRGTRRLADLLVERAMRRAASGLLYAPHNQREEMGDTPPDQLAWLVRPSYAPRLYESSDLVCVAVGLESEHELAGVLGCMGGGRR